MQDTLQGTLQDLAGICRRLRQDTAGIRYPYRLCQLRHRSGCCSAELRPGTRAAVVVLLSCLLAVCCISVVTHGVIEPVVM